MRGLVSSRAWLFVCLISLTTILLHPALSRAQSVTTIAGGFVGDGGPAISAALSAPRYLARDAAGNLYISDFARHRIRKVDPNGVITTVAGDGIAGFSGDGGPANSAHLSFPTGIAVDPRGNLIIADQGNNRIRKVNGAGIITTIAGNGAAGFSGDGGPATQATLDAPFGLVIDTRGIIYFTDALNQRVRKFAPGGIIKTVAGNGVAGFGGDGGNATLASLNFPRGLALDARGNLFIADTANHRVRQVTPRGVILTAAGTGQPGFSGDGGLAVNARTGNPRGVVLDAAGNLYISNAGRQRVRKVDAITHIITTFAGSHCCFNGDGSDALGSQFFFLTGLLFDSAGNLLIVDSGNGRVRRVDAATNIVSTVAGGFIGDGNLAPLADLDTPEGISFDRAGNLLIGDQFHHRIRKVNRSGVISTIAGIGTDGFSGDGGPATAAQLFVPVQAVVNAARQTLISDEFNGLVRRIDFSGNISTLALVGDPTFSVLDSAGNLIVADTGNCGVVKVSPSGVVTQVAGNGICDFAGDGGPAISASLNCPEGLALDGAGNLYIADTANERIRKVDRFGDITTIAGDGTCAFAGDGGPASSAELCTPVGLAIDSGRNLYIADHDNLRIRKIDTSGMMSTVAGTGNGGFNGDNLAPLATNLDGPASLLIDAVGNLFFSDDGSSLVRKIVASSAQATASSPVGAAPASAKVVH